MDKKTLIAIVLATVVLLAYQYLLPKFVQQPSQKTENKTETVNKETPASVQPTTVAMETARAKDITKDIIIDTDLYSATFTSRGGTIKNFTLKKYAEKKDSDVSLLKAQGIYAPLGTGAQDNFELSNVAFKVTGSDLKLSGSQTGSIIFEYATSQYSLKRVYTFYADRYSFDLRDEVAGLPEYWITLGTAFGTYAAEADSSPHNGPVVLKGTDRIELTVKDLAEPKVYKDSLRWIAQEDKYFFSAIVPQQQMAQQVVEARAWTSQKSTVIALKMKSGINNFTIYAGPKEYERLAALNLGLEHVIDFGFFSILARPLFWMLKFFYNYVGNYGFAIILITIITRIPFIPLLNKSQSSMKKMQDLQPKLNEIKEKFKKDPKAQQKEMMEMYKKYKVNPVGGCLPMLLQIPVFYALYKVLMIAIELRGAPFMFWVTDLSVKDPFYVLPIIMGITMLVQQKMTPSSADPKQAKIMMFMPIIFTFMFLNFASGLVLYWLVNNLLGIIQQVFVNRKASRQPA